MPTNSVAGLPPVFVPGCTFQVFDDEGRLVWAHEACPAILYVLQAGEVHVSSWDQTDPSGMRVSAGTHVVRVSLPEGRHEDHPVQAGGAASGLVVHGSAMPGTSREVRLVAPASPEAVYVAAASLSQGPGIPTCAGVVPLAPYALFDISLSAGGVGMFTDFSGVLAGSGETTAPRLNLPAEPGLSGLDLHLAFVAIYPFGGCPIASVSPAHTVTIQSRVPSRRRVRSAPFAGRAGLSIPGKASTLSGSRSPSQPRSGRFG